MKRILSLVPINKTAALVTGKGESWEPDVSLGNHQDSEIPLATRPVPFGAEDLTGISFGRMRVIGLSANHEGGRWVVRCSCGRYAIRRSKTIKKSKNSIDCCIHCQHLMYLKRNEIWRRTGKDVPYEDL